MAQWKVILSQLPGYAFALRMEDEAVGEAFALLVVVGG